MRPIATNFDHLRPILTICTNFSTIIIFDHLRPIATICDQLPSFATNCDLLRPILTTCNNFRPFAAICDTLRQFAKICDICDHLRLISTRVWVNSGFEWELGSISCLNYRNWTGNVIDRVNWSLHLILCTIFVYLL